MLPEIVEWRDELVDRVEFVFVSNGSEKSNRRKFESIEDSPILIEEDRRFALSVGGKWTPTALFVDRDGRISSHIAAGDLAIGELIDRIRTADLNSQHLYFSNGGTVTSQLKIGSQTPEFSLTDVNGQVVTSRDLRGKQTLATFWSVDCPHCQAFLDDLKAWEGSPAGRDTRVIIFSDGPEDQHRSLGFSSPVVTDKGYQVAARLGMLGTPSAVLINEEGVIVSETAIGADNILALLGAHRNGSH
jgi:peroxiredoxin